MTVYVDDMRAPHRRMKMCHMMADTREELFDMVDKIGVKHFHIQCTGTWKEHFDICLSKRALAVRHGAVEVSSKDLVRRFNPRFMVSASETGKDL